MSKRTRQAIERLVAQCKKTAGDSHQAKDRRAAAAARLVQYQRELEGVVAGRSTPAPEIMAICAQPLAGDLELLMLQEAFQRAGSNAEHFELEAARAITPEHRGQAQELAVYWKKRTANAKWRLAKYEARRIKP